MKGLYIFCVTISLLLSCAPQGERTDAEMLEIANEVYRNYLFEYGIDNELFLLSNMEVSQDGQKRYKWVAIDSRNGNVGVEVIVSKNKNIKPKMILIGTDAWIPFLGSRDKKVERVGK